MKLEKVGLVWENENPLAPGKVNLAVLSFDRNAYFWPTILPLDCAMKKSMPSAKKDSRALLCEYE